MSPRYLLTVIIAFVLVGSLPARSTPPPYGHELWQTEQGLPQNTVQTLWQTRDGYLWIGTKDGLARFDGIRFTIFDKHNTPQILHNQMRNLYEDREGRLWIATPGGLLLFERGTFTSFTTKDGLASNNVWSVFQDRSGNIWVATVNGLNQWRDGRFTTQQGLTNNSIEVIREDKDGALWIGTEGGLNRFKDGVFTGFTKQHGLAGDAVKTLFVDQQGRLWIGTTEGLSLWANGKFTSYTTRDGLAHNEVKAIAADHADALWIGTPRGLMRYRDGKFAAVTAPEVLNDAPIMSLLKDREGSLWIGTETNGLHLLKTKKFTTFTTREGLSANVVRSIFGDRHGNVWVGTQEHGLNLLRDGQIAQKSLPNDDVMAISDDAEGNLWVGTTDGLKRIKGASLTTFTERDGLSDRFIRSLYASRDGSLWIGTRRGLTHFRNGQFTPYTMLDGLPSDLVGALYEDRTSALWIGTLAGLSRFKDEKFTNYNTASGLSHEVVISLYEDADGALWIGTLGGGLNRFKDGKFTSFTTKDGLPDDVIYQILEDEQNHLWMSSNKGIIRVSRTELAARTDAAQKLNSVVTFGTADGMETRECSGGGHPAGWKTADGKLWFATIKGVAMIDPAHLKLNQQPPPVVIERVVVDDKDVAMNAAITLPPGTARFEFYYTGLSFIAPNKVTFKYKLESFDPDWIEAGTRRVAWYTNIPEGKYRFVVLACNNDGVWSEAAANIEFVLQPRFYQTWWFYALCLLTLAAGGWVWYRLRVQRLEGQFNAVLAERTRIAREIHDTLAQGFAGISVQLELVARLLTKAPEAAKPHLDQARQLVRSSLDEARRSVWALRSQALENSDLPSALNATVQQLLADTAIQSQVQVSGTYRELNRTIEDNLLRIGQEAITNAIKHAQAQQLRVELSYVTDRVKLSVQDDGRGFDSTQQSPNGHFGLVGMHERVTQMGGTLTVNSRPDAGTKILVEVPLS
ncbi:MAG TPA: two-component regulator propeller domain-containing protein [Blastocatellia bacterium]|nr:two-component regulator propeller domain-containing protein [Blastocatellia bacterium]